MKIIKIKYVVPLQPVTPHFWRFFLLLAAWLATPVWAQFDPSRVRPEPAAVAARYPDPAPELAYATPGFKAGRTDFTGHDEALDYLRSLQNQPARRARLRLETVGQSQQGRDIPLVLLSAPPLPPAQATAGPKPTVLILGQQHGNVPAGGEAALALAERLSNPDHPDSALLDSINVLILPRANPDAAHHFQRATASGLDVNRDHLLLQTPEARAIAATALRFAPQVVLDLHEFTVGDRWLAKFAAYAKYDALLQAATVGNLDAGVADLALREFIANARTALENQGHSVFWYHTSSTDPQDRQVSMGGVQADTGRNVFGLRHAVSLLIETRGIGLGRAHLARRVHSHVTATLAVLRTTARLGQPLQQAVAQAGQTSRALACQGELVVRAQATALRSDLQLVDAASGQDRTESVDWRSALTLDVTQRRSRPCGYWLAASQDAAARNLQALGVTVLRLPGGAETPGAADTPGVADAPGAAPSLASTQPIAAAPALTAVEHYRVVTEQGGQRQDARGAIAANRPIREITVATQPGQLSLPPGGWYVPLNQPLAHLAAVALEPDS